VPDAWDESRTGCASPLPDLHVPGRLADRAGAEGEAVTDRRKTLAAFIRAQANLTDKHPHTPGPGDVRLNHEEALLCAEALEQASIRGTRLRVHQNCRSCTCPEPGETGARDE
jgi:hypothetical protein